MKKLKLLIIIMMMFLISKIDIVAVEYVYEEYKIGDKITYNNMNFYVIENSNKNQDYVTLLKETPLTVDEVNKYGVDENGINHINRNTSSSVGTAYNSNGYGGMAYYTSQACGYVNEKWTNTECTAEYEKSEVKYVVDSWSNDNLSKEDLYSDKFGYSARLITIDELEDNFGYTYDNGAYNNSVNDNTSNWIYNENYWYYTMSQRRDENYDSSPFIWIVTFNGRILSTHIKSYSTTQYGISGGSSPYGVIRPVINLKKEPIATKKKLTDKELKIGDMITYNDMDFYVIEDSGEEKDYVTLLKAEPLTYEEVSNYTTKYVENFDGYGAMAYYWRDNEDCQSEECLCYPGGSEGCKSEYELSDIKVVVDLWAKNNLNEIDLIEDSMGYKVRLISLDDLVNNLSFIKTDSNIKSYIKTDSTPSFVVNGDYLYWLMNPVVSESEGIFGVNNKGDFSGHTIFYGPNGLYNYNGTVRPVITLKKQNYDNSLEKEIVENSDSNHNQVVSVPDTFLKQPIIFIILGIILIITSVIIVYILIRKKKIKINK